MGTEDNNPLLPKAHVAVPALTKAAPVLSCLLYMSVSVAMTFVNKYTMQVFPLSNIVMIMQMVATWMILQPLRPILGFKPFSLARARQFLYITIMYTASTAFALIGLKTLNVPMYNVIKRLTPMTVLVFKAFVRKQWPPVQIIASVVMVVVGCIVAGVGDLMFDLSGYVFCLLSCACQAAYLLLVEFKGNQAHAPVSSQEMLYYNCLTSLPLLMLLVWADGEAASLPGAYATVGVITCAQPPIGLPACLRDERRGMTRRRPPSSCTITPSPRCPCCWVLLRRRASCMRCPNHMQWELRHTVHFGCGQPCCLAASWAAC
ncbi:hypothetical protein DUNSADRAFT_4992 [Dunaliella salina]|uniref:Sugar phosphate transporter domain-containing protein n=1 Tax=Dunaliella salina TaxID=3046 RepID=A0ABQ7FUG9_DUNSA|nr:hypothetical protein DUNSADRAFT_4992 [Dunaliella salina]|eukprot:KAF5826065.1 hypothetical protein DUNSADRAFT_4992 [Dunaliella salina]